MKSRKRIAIGLVGFGTVGSGVYAALEKERTLLAHRSGWEFQVHSIAVRNLKKKRPDQDIPTPYHLMTDSWQTMVTDPTIPIIVELIGGTTEALKLVRRALSLGKIVVTGNKALLANHGRELMALADQYQTSLLFEAAVAGGIPIIKALQEGFIGNKISSIQGILNGTTNYILSEMEATPGRDYQPTLAAAIQHGYAEADPTLDLNGWDAGHKTLILAALAYSNWLPPSSLYVDGITQITALDIQFAQELGYSIKLLATIRQESATTLSFSVAPTLLPQSSMLASVKGVFNAIALEGDLVGESLFYGRGAGQKPTTSAVIADLIEAATFSQIREKKASGSVPTPHSQQMQPVPSEEITSSFYLRLGVADQPGVLGNIAQVFGELGIGIASVIQPETSDQKSKPVVLMTYRTQLGTIQKAIAELEQLSSLREKPLLLFVASS